MKTETLPCPLTEYELNERRDEMAKLVGEEAKIEAAKKAANDEFKEQLERCGSTIRHLAKQVRERSEDRAVEVDERWDDVRLCVETFRLDSGEIIHSRPMTQAEVVDARQAALPGIGKRRGRKSVEDRVIDAIDKAAADKIKKAIE